MKRATGIVRRIDDLGRIIIPKEIRRGLGIREGDPFEIFIEGKGVYLEKYSPLTEQEEDIIKYCRLLNKILVEAVYITDNQNIIASAGFKKDLRGLPILDDIKILNEIAGTYFNQLYKQNIFEDPIHGNKGDGEIIIALHENLEPEEKVMIARFANYIRDNINEF